MTSSLRVIVSGLIAQYPLGGVAWDYLQYVLGLKQLGHDVYYLEDTGQSPYHPFEDSPAREASFHTAYLSHVMSSFGLGDKWAYCFSPHRQWFGLSDSERTAVISSADLLINVSCALARLDSYRNINRRVYVDTDPVFTQIKLARGQKDFKNVVASHNRLFSYGERLAVSGPDTGHRWLPMRKPIVVSEWRPNASHRETFTTVMNWTSYKDVKFQGQTYGQKDSEFMRFLDLPSRVAPTMLEIAIGNGKTRRGSAVHPPD